MILKFISTIVSAIFISIVGTIFNYSPSLAEGDSYYSFGRQFFGGLVIILAIYILLLIPLTVFIDGLVYRIVPKHGAEQKTVKFIAYLLIPAACILLLFSLFVNVKTSAAYAILLGLGGLLLAIIQESIRWFIKRQRRS